MISDLCFSENRSLGGSGGLSSCPLRNLILVLKPLLSLSSSMCLYCCQDFGWVIPRTFPYEMLSVYIHIMKFNLVRHS